MLLALGLLAKAGYSSDPLWMVTVLGLVLLGAAFLLSLPSGIASGPIPDSYAALSPTAMVEIHASGQVTYANLAAENAFPGINKLDAMHPLVVSVWEKVLEAGTDPALSFDFSHANRLFEVRAHYLKERDTWILYFTDATAHKDFEDVLKDRDEIFRKLVEGTNEALIMTDADNNIELVNNQFLNLFGYKRAEVLHHNAVSLLMKDADPDTVRRRHKDRLKGISDVYELEQKRKDGEPLWTLVSASPFRDRNGKVVGTIAALTDITALKKVERLLNERNEQMDLFLYKATHDLKGPLASIQGILNIAMEQCEQPAVRQYIDMAVTSASRLDNALVDLIQVTRINKSELRIQPVVLREVLDEVITGIQHMPEVEGVRLMKDIRMQNIFHTDRASIVSILQNLVVNAVKYKRQSEPNPEVKIRIYPHDQGIRIEVSDNGEGMSADIQEKIFRMFYRGNKKSKGTGLGLYIVQKIIEKLNGTISLTSKAGKGSRFTVYLPELPAAETEEEEIAESVTVSA